MPAGFGDGGEGMCITSSRRSLPLSVSDPTPRFLSKAEESLSRGNFPIVQVKVRGLYPIRRLSILGRPVLRQSLAFNRGFLLIVLGYFLAIRWESIFVAEPPPMTVPTAVGDHTAG